MAIIYTYPRYIVENNSRSHSYLYLNKKSSVFAQKVLREQIECRYENSLPILHLAHLSSYCYFSANIPNIDYYLSKNIWPSYPRGQ